MTFTWRWAESLSLPERPAPQRAAPPQLSLSVTWNMTAVVLTGRYLFISTEPSALHLVQRMFLGFNKYFVHQSVSFNANVKYRQLESVVHLHCGLGFESRRLKSRLIELSRRHQGTAQRQTTVRSYILNCNT